MNNDYEILQRQLKERLKLGLKIIWLFLFGAILILWFFHCTNVWNKTIPVKYDSIGDTTYYVFDSEYNIVPMTFKKNQKVYFTGQIHDGRLDYEANNFKLKKHK